MAHEISTVTIDGRQIVEAMYANSPAWHGLGQLFDVGGENAPDSATAMELAHLDWTVEKQSLYLGDGSDSGLLATVRTDTGKALGHVTDRYTVLQNRDAFSFLDSLQLDGIIRYESAFAMRDGRQIALVARLPQVDEFAENDYGLRYIMLRTSHDCSSEIDIVPTSVRVVCANTVRAALSQDARFKVTVRHTGDMRDKLNQARQYLAMFSRQFDGYADSVRVLASKQYSQADAAQYINELFPVSGTERQMRAIKHKVAAVRQAFGHSSNRLPSINGSWWKLYNSVSWAIDHDRQFNRRRGDARRRAEAKFDSLIDGDSAQLKTQALELAYRFATAT